MLYVFLISYNNFLLFLIVILKIGVVFDLKETIVSILFLHSHASKLLSVLSTFLEKISMVLQLFKWQQTLC